MRIKIGDLNIRMVNDTDNIASRLFTDFIVEEDGADCYEIRLLEEPPILKESRCLFVDNRLCVLEGDGRLLESRIYRNPMTGNIFAYNCIYDTYSEVYYCEALSNHKDSEFLYLMSLALDKIAFFQSCFVLHSSSILVDGEMILFSAPSGTGKSTQADLWKEYRNATIVNGDRNLLFGRDGKFYAQGWVLSGSSEHRKNICAPIRAIVTLDKSPVNQIRSLAGMQALRKLYQETISNHWDSECVNAEMDFLAELLQKVPVFLYVCTKTEDAVDYLERCLKGFDSQGDR